MQTIRLRATPNEAAAFLVWTAAAALTFLPWIPIRWLVAGVMVFHAVQSVAPKPAAPPPVQNPPSVLVVPDAPPVPNNPAVKKAMANF